MNVKHVASSQAPQHRIYMRDPCYEICLNQNIELEKLIALCHLSKVEGFYTLLTLYYAPPKSHKQQPTVDTDQGM